PGVAVGGMMERPVPRAVLKDEERKPRLNDIVVPAPAHGDALVEVVGADERLVQRADAALTLQEDAEPLADRARPAVAPDQVACADRLLGPAGRAQPGPP